MSASDRADENFKMLQESQDRVAELAISLRAAERREREAIADCLKQSERDTEHTHQMRKLTDQSARIENHWRETAKELGRAMGAIIEIDLLACYGSEENPDACKAALLKIGELARAAQTRQVPEHPFGFTCPCDACKATRREKAAQATAQDVPPVSINAACFAELQRALSKAWKAIEDGNREFDLATAVYTAKQLVGPLVGNESANQATHAYDPSREGNFCSRCGGGPAAHTSNDKEPSK